MPWFNELTIWYGHLNNYDYIKYIELCVKLEKSDIDIIALSGIDDLSFEQNDLDIPGYNLMYSFTSTKGVCMYIKEFIPFYLESNDRMLHITLRDGTTILIEDSESKTKYVETCTDSSKLKLSAHNMQERMPSTWIIWKLQNSGNGIVMCDHQREPKSITDFRGIGGTCFFEIMLDCDHTGNNVNRNKVYTVYHFDQLRSSKLTKLNKIWRKKFPDLNVEACSKIIYVDIKNALRKVR